MKTMNVKAILAVALLCLLGYSCQRDVIEPEAITLKVEKSEGKVVLSAEGTEVNLGVSTNSPDWTAMAEDAWLEVVQGEKQITLKAQRNTSMASRSTSVQVLAGGLSRRIAVEQSSGVASVDLGFAPRAVDQWGGTLRIDLSSNADTWEATTEADWITLERDTQEQQLVVSVAEHTERRKRVATIEVRASEGAEPKTIEVRQDGIRYWLLPILDKGQTMDNIQTKEMARRHKLAGPPPNSWAFEKVYKFETISPAFPRLEYILNRTNDYLFCKAILKDVATLEGDEYKEFVEFLVANKFEDKGNQVFWSEELRTEAEVVLEAVEPFVKYTYYPVDPNDYPTTKHYPFQGMKLGSSTPEDVDTYQKSIGGVLDDKRSTASRKVYLHQSASKPVVYDYTFTTDNKLSKLIYTDGLIGRYIYLGTSVVYLNNSFRGMIHGEGFKYHSRDAYTSYIKDTYRNYKTSTDMVVEVVGTNAYVGGPAVVLTFKAY